MDSEGVAMVEGEEVAASVVEVVTVVAEAEGAAASVVEGVIAAAEEGEEAVVAEAEG